MTPSFQYKVLNLYSSNLTKANCKNIFSSLKVDDILFLFNFEASNKKYNAQ